MEKRKAPRKLLHYSAWVAVEGEENRSCIITDISDIGARLELSDPQNVPDRFVLLLAAGNAPKRYCKTIWRKPDAVGVAFENRTLATLSHLVAAS